MQKFFEGQHSIAKKDFKKFISSEKDVAALALFSLEKDFPDAPNRTGWHPGFRRLSRDLFKALYLLVRINKNLEQRDSSATEGGQSPPAQDPVFKDFISFLIILEKIQSEHFYKGKFTPIGHLLW